MKNNTKIEEQNLINNDFDNDQSINQMVEVVESPEDKAIIEEMLKSGVQFGHKKTKGHPKMAQYVYTLRNNIQIINLSKTLAQLKIAADFLKNILTKEGTVLFVGTNPSAKELIKDLANDLKMPYVSERWLGGTLTNFQTIKKRINYFLDLLKKKETGELEKYTKKEKLLIDRDIKKLEINFGGIRAMEKLPDAVFIVDIKEHSTAVNEAKKINIPIVAICDTDVDPTDIAYPIASNDGAYSAIKFILNYISKNIK